MKRLLIGLLLLAGLLSLTVWRLQPRRTVPSSEREVMRGLVVFLDADNDGRISRFEWALNCAEPGPFIAADANSDGFLSADELAGLIHATAPTASTAAMVQ